MRSLREMWVTAAILAGLGLALAACSDSHPPPPSPADNVASAKVVRHDCSDPSWRKQNLGLWYSVCRPPMRW